MLHALSVLKQCNQVAEPLDCETHSLVRLVVTCVMHGQWFRHLLVVYTAEALDPAGFQGCWAAQQTSSVAKSLPCAAHLAAPTHTLTHPNIAALLHSETKSAAAEHSFAPWAPKSAVPFSTARICCPTFTHRCAVGMCPPQRAAQRPLAEGLPHNSSSGSRCRPVYCTAARDTGMEPCSCEATGSGAVDVAAAAGAGAAAGA